VPGAPQHQHLLDGRALGERDVGRLLERYDVAAAPRAVARDQDLGLGVLDAVAQRIGGEAAEHHRVRAPMRAHASSAIGSSGTMPR